MTTIKPVGEWIVCKVETGTTGAIIIPDSVSKPDQILRVDAVGEKITTIKMGDIIVMRATHPTLQKWIDPKNDQNTIYMVHINDIIGTLENYDVAGVC